MWPFGKKLTADEKRLVDGCKAAVHYIDALPGNMLDRDQYIHAWKLAGRTIDEESAKQMFRDAHDIARSEKPPVDHLVHMRGALKRLFTKAIKDPTAAIADFKRHGRPV